jgi:hypothetical protein
MKTIYQPISLARTIRFSHETAAYLDRAVTDVSTSLLRSRATFPLLTTPMRAITILVRAIADVDGTPGTDPNRKLTALLGVGTTLGKVSQAFTLWIIQERTKLLRGWVSNEIVADAVAGLVGRDQANPLISDAQLYELFLYAVPGSGPERTHELAASAAAGLVKLASEAQFEGEDPTIAATYRLTLACLLYYLKASLDVPGQESLGLATGKQDQMLEIRAQEMRKLASYMLGAGASATHAVARHFLRWMKDPWVLQSAIGKTADSIMRVTEEFEMRTLPTGPFTGLSMLDQADHYDASIIALPNIIASVNLDGTTVLPSTQSEFFHPLASDLQYPIIITEADLTPWVETAWTLTRRAESWATDLTQYGDPSVSSISLPSHSNPLRGDGGVAGVTSSDGYPLVSESDPTVLWPTTRWSLRSLELDVWQLQTRAKIIETMRNRVEIPVRITGPAQREIFSTFPALQPMFKDIDEAAPTMEPSMEALAVLWNSTNHRITTYLASLPLDPSSMGWRATAHALRFVGQLIVKGVPVQPFSMSWYHGGSFAAEVFGKPINLIGEGTVQLLPFNAVPTSARLRDLPTHLALLETTRPFADLPALRWLDPGPARATNVHIRGWSIAPGELQDIVLVHSVPKAKDLYITGQQSGSPLAARGYNAVLSVADPVVSDVGPTASIPPGAYALLP